MRTNTVFSGTRPPCPATDACPGPPGSRDSPFTSFLLRLMVGHLDSQPVVPAGVKRAQLRGEGLWGGFGSWQGVWLSSHCAVWGEETGRMAGSGASRTSNATGVGRDSLPGGL